MKSSNNTNVGVTGQKAQGETQRCMAPNGRKEAEWIWMEKLERGHAVSEAAIGMEELISCPLRQGMMMMMMMMMIIHGGSKK